MIEVAAWLFVWALVPLESKALSKSLTRQTNKMKVFGVEREIDIPDEVAPTPTEIQAMEDLLPPCEHGWFDSVSKAAKLHYRKFLPAAQKPKGVVCFMHGISTHSGKALVLHDGRKQNTALLADRFMKEGYAMYAFDLYGHGYSEGTRWLIPDTWEGNRDDLINFVKMVTQQHDNDTPIFLMGISYGCTLCIHAARHFQDNPSNAPKNFQGVILTSPAIVGDLPAYPVYFVLRYMLAPYFPRWRPFFMPNPISPERIWRDPEVLKKCTEERFIEMMIDGSGIPFRLGTGLNLVLALEAVRTNAIPGFKVPYCLVHGTCDYGVPIEGSEYMWETAETPQEDRVFNRVEGAYHDVFADPVAEECMDFIIDWIKKRIKK